MDRSFAKTNISHAADQALERMLQLVNTNFNGGKIKKQDLCSWILVHAESTFPKHVSEVQMTYFDEVAYLKAMVCEMSSARRNGRDLPDLAAVLKRLRPKRKGEVGTKDQDGAVDGVNHE